MKNKFLISVILAETFCFILLYLLLVIFYNSFEMFSLILTIIFYLICLIVTLVVYKLELNKQK